MSNSDWKLGAVRRKAASLGLRVEFARKLFGPKHIQNRIFINGHRCQLASRFIPPGNPDRTAALPVPQSTWASFVIYVPPPGQNEPFFVIPQAVFRSTNLQAAEQLLNYADQWSLLAKATVGSTTEEYKTPQFLRAEERTSA